MFIVSPRQLLSLIRRSQTKTLTVDIFDTILLRKIYPEDKQFLLHARKAVSVLKDYLSLDIEPFYFYSLRRYCRSLIDDNKSWSGLEREAQIKEIFALVIDVLLQKYSRSLTEQQREELVNRLIEEELLVEKANLKLNLPLVQVLRKLKASGIRLFFISDMYLSCDHVKKLLDLFEAGDVFDDGFCSSDGGYGKSKGKIFLHLKKNNRIPEFYLTDNVHLGDNPISDYRAPRLLGIHAVHYKTVRNFFYRPIKFWSGELQLQIARWRYKKKLQQQLRDHCKVKTASYSRNQKILYKFGFTVAPALLKYLEYVSWMSKIAAEPIFFLSSEGRTFTDLLHILGRNEGVYTLESFNRINLLRAYTYLHFQKSTLPHAEPLLKVFSKGEGKSTLEDFLKSIGVSRFDYGLTKLALHQISLRELIQKLLQSEVGHRLMLKNLNKSYESLLEELQKQEFLKYEKVIVADIGWGGTIQILLEQMLEFLKRDLSLRGIYFGLTGFNMFKLPRPRNMKGVIFESLQDPFAQKALIEEIWENILTHKNPDNEKLNYIQKGIEGFFKYYRKDLQATPDSVFSLYRNKIIRALHKPTKREVLLLGSLEHDVGFGSDLVRPLVDIEQSKWQMYKTLLFSPRRFASLYSKQYWSQGFGVWYGFRLPLLWSTAIYLKLRSFIKKPTTKS